MSSNIIMRSKDRILFDVVIRQDTKDSFLNLSDLNKAYARAREINRWSIKHLDDILKTNSNIERIYYIIREQIINEVDKTEKTRFYETYPDYTSFKEVVDKVGLPKVLKKYEQIAIEKYNPKYNVYTAYTGLTREQYSKQYHKQYNKENSDSIKQYKKQYYEENIDSIKQYQKQYNKENATAIKQQQKQYYNQQCLYEGELLSLSALSHRFIKKGIQHPVVEAKKYLIQQQ